MYYKWHIGEKWCFVLLYDMKLDKLFWSKAKADILKYLVFRRQGISVRAFERICKRFPKHKKTDDEYEDLQSVEEGFGSMRCTKLTEDFQTHSKS